jgi:DNA methylase
VAKRTNSGSKAVSGFRKRTPRARAKGRAGELFIETGGQLRMADKSVEQVAVESGRVECLGLTFDSEDARRQHFLARLSEKLKDPQFRKTPGFPIGEDEDILALSDPPYYTACPNPFLRDFIAQKGQPYDGESDDSRVEPFASDVSEGKQDPICMAHTYHTKVPYRAIMRYILHYTRPGDVVLDSFAGTGMTGLAAQLCAEPDTAFRDAVEREWVGAGKRRPVWGRRAALLFDLSPFATFLARNFTSTLDVNIFSTDAQSLLSASEDSLGWMYETERASDRAKGQLQYIIWTESVFCDCGRELLFWNPKKATGALPEPAHSMRCPDCDAEVTKRGAKRVTSTTADALLRSAVTQNKQTPVLIEARYGDKLIRLLPSKYDLELIERIARQTPAHYVPSQPMMFDGRDWGDMFRAGYHFGITHTHHFWTKRNLLVLSDLVARAMTSRRRWEMLFLCTSFAVKTGSRMHNVGFKDGKLNLAGQVYNTLQLTSISAERNLYVLARGKVDDIKSVFEAKKAPGSTIISTSSATQLVGVPDNSVDYVFVDPPFGDNIMYSELSFLYEAWLRVFTRQESEAIMSGKQSKALPDYQALMLRAFRELFRVLKPGRWITVAFHNSKNAVWNAIQEALGNAGFVVADVRTLDKGQGTYKQMTTAGAVKQDLVISAYKPNGGLDASFALHAGTPEGAWDFVRQHLCYLPNFVQVASRAEVVAERQAFLLFDRMVAFHIQRGAAVPLSAAEFYVGLKQRFPERDYMYFLPDQVAEYDRRRLQVDEVAQLAFFVADERSAIQWLRRQLESSSQTYQEIQPKFLRELHQATHEQFPELLEMLHQNFLEDEERRWYVPDPNKQLDLERLRDKALLREFESYKVAKQKRLKTFRTEAVRAGFKAAWAARDYQTIVAVSQKLPEDVLQEDQTILMYFDNASMRVGG